MGLVIKEHRELEEMNSAIESLVTLGRHKLCQVGWEIEALFIECDRLIEEVGDLKKHNKLLREDTQRCKDKKAAMKRVLVGVKEELAQFISKCKRL